MQVKEVQKYPSPCPRPRPQKQTQVSQRECHTKQYDEVVQTDLLPLGVPVRQLGTHGVLYTGTAAKRGTGATHQGHQEGREPEQKECRMCNGTQNMRSENLNNNTGSTIYSTDTQGHRLEKQRNTELQHDEAER